MSIYIIFLMQILLCQSVLGQTRYNRPETEEKKINISDTNNFLQVQYSIIGKWKCVCKEINENEATGPRMEHRISPKYIKKHESVRYTTGGSGFGDKSDDKHKDNCIFVYNNGYEYSYTYGYGSHIMPIEYVDVYVLNSGFLTITFNEDSTAEFIDEHGNQIPTSYTRWYPTSNIRLYKDTINFSNFRIYLHNEAKLIEGKGQEEIYLDLSPFDTDCLYFFNVKGSPFNFHGKKSMTKYTINERLIWLDVDNFWFNKSNYVCSRLK